MTPRLQHFLSNQKHSIRTVHDQFVICQDSQHFKSTQERVVTTGEEDRAELPSSEHCRHVTYPGAGTTRRYVFSRAQISAFWNELGATVSQSHAYSVKSTVSSRPKQAHESIMARLKRSPAQHLLRPPANVDSPPLGSRRDPSPGLTANLPSNNPFRNRAVSPANSLPSPINNTFNVPSTAPERPRSRNPFLDQTEKKDSTTVQVRSASPEQGTSRMAGRSPTKKPALSGHAVELFVRLFNSFVHVVTGSSTSFRP